jgi:hypothetical protein
VRGSITAAMFNGELAPAYAPKRGRQILRVIRHNVDYVALALHFAMASDHPGGVHPVSLESHASRAPIHELSDSRIATICRSIVSVRPSKFTFTLEGVMHLLDDKGRQSLLFLKKKQQKDFIFRDQPNIRPSPNRHAGRNIKVFWFFSSEKERLCCTALQMRAEKSITRSKTLA